LGRRITWPRVDPRETVDGRAYQYALAYSLRSLTGNFRLTAPAPQRSSSSRRRRAPASIRDLAPSIPSRLAAAIEKALAKAPRERYATCVEFVQSAIGAGGSGATLRPRLVWSTRPSATSPPWESLARTARPSASTRLRFAGTRTPALTSPAAQNIRPQSPAALSRAHGSSPGWP